MSISLVGATDAGGFQASVTVDVPAGVADGDRLLLLASANDQNTITSLPSGWAVLVEEEIGTGVSVWVFTRVADGEPADYTVEWSGGHWHFLNLIALRGVASIRSHEVDSDDSASTIDLPSLNAEDSDALVAFGFNDEATGKSFPGALAEITNLDRGIISAWEADLDAGPTTAHTLTADDPGHIAATAILLTPSSEPADAPMFPLDIRTELLLDGTWIDISSDVRDTEDVIIARGRADEAAIADAASLSLLLNNRDGIFSPRNPRSPHFGVLGRNTAIRVSVVVGEEQLFRFAGEVSEWPMAWDLSGNDVWVTLQASGPLRRFNQSAGPEQSALRRFKNAAAGVLAYWPLTDGTNSVIAAPDVGPHPMAVLVGSPPGGSLGVRRELLDWHEGRLAPWLEPVARTRLEEGRIVGRVDAAAATTGGWSADLVRAGAGGQDRLVILGRSEASGDTQEWRIRFDQDSGDIAVFNRIVPEDAAAPGFTTLSTTTDERFFAEQLRHVRLTVTDDGAGESDWSLHIDGGLIDSGTTSGFEAPVPVSSAQYWWDLRESVAPDGEHAAIGHITVYDEDADPPNAFDVTGAMLGHLGERAGRRIERITEEEGITLQVTGDLEDTLRMGPQRVASPLATIRDAETVDGGVLYEARDDVALAYRTNRSRYNQELS